MNIVDTINFASQAIDSMSNFIPKIIGFASIAAALLPPPGKDSKLAILHSYINTIAFNFKHARNAEQSDEG
jgi:hypothetical protein